MAESWSADVQLAQIGIKEAPSGVHYGHQLYVFHQGSEDNYLWYCVFDGSTWGADQPVPGSVTMTASPSAVAFDNKIYVFYRPADGSASNVRYKVFDGEYWREEVRLSDTYIAAGPSAVVFGNSLYLLHAGSDSRLWYKVMTLA